MVPFPHVQCTLLSKQVKQGFGFYLVPYSMVCNIVPSSLVLCEQDGMLNATARVNRWGYLPPFLTSLNPPTHPEDNKKYTHHHCVIIASSLK